MYKLVLCYAVPIFLALSSVVVRVCHENLAAMRLGFILAESATKQLINKGIIWPESTVLDSAKA